MVVATDVAGNVVAARLPHLDRRRRRPGRHDHRRPDVADQRRPRRRCTFTVDDPTADAECSLDGGAWAPCTSPVSRTGLGDGTHSVSVRATDAAGNTSAVDSTSWTVDTVAPVVAITEAPTRHGRHHRRLGDLHGDRPVRRLGRVQRRPRCLGAVLLAAPVHRGRPGPPLDLGAGHRRGRQPVAGRQSRTWTVDTVAPVVTITGGPTGTVGDDDAEHHLHRRRPRSRRRRRAAASTAAPPRSCTSPVTYDRPGRTASTPSRSGPPTRSATSGPPTTGRGPSRPPSRRRSSRRRPPALTNQADAVVTFTSDIGGATFECRLDGGAWAGVHLAARTSATSPTATTGSRCAPPPTASTDPTPADAEWDARHRGPGRDPDPRAAGAVP